MNTLPGVSIRKTGVSCSISGANCVEEKLNSNKKGALTLQLIKQ
jgi:hypothetical protein